MKRNLPLKFRVWDLHLKKFVDMENAVFEMTPEGLKYCQQKMDKYHGYVIQQWTGLRDKNNKEIYEGDIVKVNEDHDEILLQKIFNEKRGIYTNGVIKFVCEGWSVCQPQIGRSPLSDFVCCHEHPAALEIVGNFFDNPELL